jgi:hypothetical protein
MKKVIGLMAMVLLLSQIVVIGQAMAYSRNNSGYRQAGYGYKNGHPSGHQAYGHVSWRGYNNGYGHSGYGQGHRNYGNPHDYRHHGYGWYR